MQEKLLCKWTEGSSTLHCKPLGRVKGKYSWILTVPFWDMLIRTTTETLRGSTRVLVSGYLRSWVEEGCNVAHAKKVSRWESDSEDSILR